MRKYFRSLHGYAFQYHRQALAEDQLLMKGTEMPNKANGTTSRDSVRTISWVSGAALLLAGLVGTASTATASPTATPSIIGGQPSTAPWAVYLVGQGVRCSAIAINPLWVITARHCPSSGEIVFHNGSGKFHDGRATVISVAQAITAPMGDIKVLRLSKPHALATYPEVNLDYVPRPGQVGTIYGAGSPEYGVLRQATVNVIGASKDYYGGSAAQVQGVTGAAYPGDSGGPLVVNGKAVGVASTSTISGIYSNSWYGLFTPAKDFFSRYIIGKPTLDGNLARLEMGKEWFNSNQRIMLWINGHYAGETFNGINYYMWSSDSGGKVILRPSRPVRSGDRVQVGIVGGRPGNTPPSPASSQMLVDVVLDQPSRQPAL